MAFLLGIALTLPMYAEEEENYDIQESPSETQKEPESTASHTPSSITKAPANNSPLKKYVNSNSQKCPLGECDPYSDEDDEDCEDFVDNRHHCFWEDENDTQDSLYRDGDLDADWPGKRTDPFFDNLTR